MASRIGADTQARILAAWPRLLAALAGGELVKDAIKAEGLSRNEVDAYKASLPQARVEWDLAREASADSFMDEALDIARSPVHVLPPLVEGGEPRIVQVDSSSVRNRIDTLKWAARIRNPRTYGDKAQLDVNVKTVDLTRIIEAANARVLAAQGRVIEHNNGIDRALAHAQPVLIAASAQSLADLL